MSERESTLIETQQLNTHEKIARRFVLAVFSKLTRGEIVLRERGSVVATMGCADSSTRADVNVLNPSFYTQLMWKGSIGAAEAYLNNDWETPDLTALLQYFARNLDILDELEGRFSWLLAPFDKLRHWSKANSKKQAKENIAAHYDLGNSLYTAFLDQHMQYSSAVFPAPDATLEEAQECKMQQLCEQLQLNADDHLLEIGTGWGGLAIYAAKNYGCKVTTTTISQEQFDYAAERIQAAGLEQKITLLKQDYRELQGQYDKLISVEMIEAVGFAYMPEFFQRCSALLKPKGKLVIQAITIADQRMKKYAKSVDFIQKYIFPGGFLPSLTLIASTLTNYTNLVIRNVDDIGLDYARTLEHWRTRFNSAFPQLKSQGYDQRFSRLWNYYFSYCEAGFLERRTSAIQLLASKPA